MITQLFPFHEMGQVDIKHCVGWGMLNDIARENTIRDRLADLKLLSGRFDDKEVWYKPNTWGIFGGGKAKVDGGSSNEKPRARKGETGPLPEEPIEEYNEDYTSEDEGANEAKGERAKRRLKRLTALLGAFDTLIDPQQYIVIHIWAKEVPVYMGNYTKTTHFELRKYDRETDLCCFVDKVKYSIEDCIRQHHQEYDIAEKRRTEMETLYQVIQQRYDSYDETLTEIRKIYGDDTEEKWEYRNDVWKNITTEADYEGL
jgi:hypothetical protein